MESGSRRPAPAGASPVPCRFRVYTTALGTVLVNAMVPFTVPVTVGVMVTPMVQCAPIASGVAETQVLLAIENCADATKELNIAGLAVLLVTVAVRVPLCVPVC